MRRVVNWDSAVKAAVTPLLGRPFEWGETDCASVSVACLNAMYDEPIYPKTLYKSLRGARELWGYVDIGKVAERASGHAVGPQWATYGDIAVGDLDSDGFPSLYFVLRGCAVTSSKEKGVFTIPLAKLKDRVTFYRFP